MRRRERAKGIALGFVNLVLFVLSGPIMLVIEIAGWLLARSRPVGDEADDWPDELLGAVERVRCHLVRGELREGRHECERALERMGAL